MEVRDPLNSERDGLDLSPGAVPELRLDKHKLRKSFGAAGALPLTRRPKTSPIRSTHLRVAATNRTHECVTAYGEKKVRARRTWKVLGAKHHHSSTEQLELDLAAFNRCIDVLEKAEVNPLDIEVLTAHTLALAEQIDEVRWSNPAKALAWLLERETRKPAARKFREPPEQLFAQRNT